MKPRKYANATDMGSVALKGEDDLDVGDTVMAVVACVGDTTTARMYSLRLSVVRQ